MRGTASSAPTAADHAFRHCYPASLLQRVLETDILDLLTAHNPRAYPER